MVADVTGSSPTGRTFNSVVVAFNNNNLPTPIAGKLAGVIGWSVSSDLSHTTWTTHAENSSLNDVFLTGPAPIMADSAPYAATAGDPALVATGCPGQLALASLGGSATNPAVDIVMAISNDGGNSFKNLKRMSDNTSAGTGVDQPKLVMEEPGTQVGWVVWANFNNPWAAFGRRLHFNCATGDIDPPGPITDLRLDSPMLNFLNVTPVCGKTPILDNCAGAGIEHMFVAYPDLGPGSGYLTQAVPNRPVDCGPGNFNPLTDDIVWTLAFGNPGSWNLVNAARDRFDPLCVVNELIGNAGVTGSLNNGKQPGNQRWEPAMVYEPKLRKVHVFLSLSQYWGKSGVRDDSRGTRIHHITWDGMGQTINTDEELSKVFTVPDTPGRPGVISCTAEQGHADDECYVDQFAPAVATGLAGDVSWIAVSWHDTRQTPNPATTGATGGSGGPGTFQPLQVLDAPVAMASKSNGLMGSYGFLETLAQGAGTPFLNTGQQGNTPWGDYEGMGVDRSGSVPSFYPAWGDNRDGLTTTQVWVASYLP